MNTLAGSLHLHEKESKILPDEEFEDGLGLGLDDAGRGRLDEDVAVLAVLEGEEHEVDSLVPTIIMSVLS